MITVALPDDEIRERLGPPPEGARYLVWDLESGPAPEAIDLLVLPYMRPAAALRVLAGQPVRLLQSQSLGFDGVADALPPGLTYCNAVDVHEASTAELALALVLAAQRGLPGLFEAQREGRWAHARFPGLAGRRVLLIGVGGVGRAIERLLLPFDVDLVLVAHTARPDAATPVHGVEELPALLPAADIVILAVPLTGDTRGMVSTAFLAAMQRDALLVNVSRGPVVDTEALVVALGEGRIRAATDVTDPEPLPAGHPLWRLPGVIITPHVGGHTAAMAGRVDRLIREQVRRLLAGEPPQNVVLTT